jgi:hypothetical protein
MQLFSEACGRKSQDRDKEVLGRDGVGFFVDQLLFYGLNATKDLLENVE